MFFDGGQRRKHSEVNALFGIGAPPQALRNECLIWNWRTAARNFEMNAVFGAGDRHHFQLNPLFENMWIFFNYL